MDDEIRQPRPPGTELVARRPSRDGASVPPQLLVATDLAVGVAAQATRVALRVGEIGWDATIVASRLVAALPGADGAARLLDMATRPLLQDGRDVRGRATSTAQTSIQRLLEQVVSAVVDALDIDAIVSRVDIDALVRRIVIDDVVARIDIDRLVRRIEIDALVSRIDIDALVRRIVIDDVVANIDVDALVRRIDVGDIAARIDVNEVVQRVDVDAIVEETELGTIVARSTSGFATAALDAARSQTAGVDTRLSRAVNRVLRRRDDEVPVGPPLLTGDADIDEEPSDPGAAGGTPTERASGREDNGESLR